MCYDVSVGNIGYDFIIRRRACYAAEYRNTEQNRDVDNQGYDSPRG